MTTTQSDLRQQQQAIKQTVDEALLQRVDELANHAPRLKAAMRHALLSGGKRLRPLLTFLTGETLGIDEKLCLRVAMAVECIHAYSLVHDDLPAMDDDDLRRGQPTCHIAFDEATAILAGDALQTEAFQLLSEQPMGDASAAQQLALVAELARASGYSGMCGGQAIDLASTGISIPFEQLVTLHRLKTGALLSACVTMVAKLSPHLPNGELDALKTFAGCVGMAFQIQDDILDVTGTTASLGKPQGSDEAAGKNTFPALLGMDGARKELAQMHQLALQALAALPYNTDNLAAFCDLMIQRDH